MNTRSKDSRNKSCERRATTIAMATLAVAALGHTATAMAQADKYPSRPIRFVIPFPPGGTTDLMSRPVADRMSQTLGQPMLMDFRPGASSIVGTEIVSKATPDGYTVLFGGMPPLTMNPATFKKLPYDVARDIAPIGLVGGYNLVLIARMGLPAKNIPELVNYAKSRPGQVTYATTGVAGPPHFGSVMLEQMAGIKMQHIPFKGNAQINTSMLAEEIDISFGGLSSVQALLRANKLRLLATGGPRRLAILPDLPAVAETYPGFQAGTWFSLVTRKGTPRPIIQKLNAELNRALQQPDLRAQLEAGGYEPADGKGMPENLAELIASDTKRWARIAKEAKIETD